MVKSAFDQKKIKRVETSVAMRGSVLNRRRRHVVWLRTEWLEGSECESGRPGGDETPSGVRGTIVALMHRNGCGAKGARKVDAKSHDKGSKTIGSGRKP